MRLVAFEPPSYRGRRRGPPSCTLDHGPLQLRGGRLGRREQDGQHPPGRPDPGRRRVGPAGARPHRVPTEDAAAPDVVRETILASWTRSREWNIPVDHLDVPFETDSTAIRPAAGRAAGAGGRRRAVRGRARERHPHRRRRRGARAAHRRLALEQAWTGSGWPPASATPRSSSAPTASAPRWRAAARPRCSATSTTSSTWRSSPARARRSGTRSRGKLLGVIDLTCWRQDAGFMMAAAASRWPADRGDAAGPVRAPRAGPAARLPHRLPAQPRRGVRGQPRPGDAQRPGARADRPRRPGPAARRRSRRWTPGAALLLVDLPSGLIARVQCGRASPRAAARAACCTCS